MTIFRRSTTTICVAAVRRVTRSLATLLLFSPATRCRLTRTRCWHVPLSGRGPGAIIEEVARATGTIDGMIGGQVIDLEAEHTSRT